MANPSEVHVLDKFRPYLHLLTAFNRSQFHRRNRLEFLYSVLCTLSAAAIIVTMFSFLVLFAWYLLEIDANSRKFIVAIPVILSVLQLELTFIALMIQNHSITKTIEQLQRAVDQRCAASKRSHAIYAASEKKHASISTTLFKLFMSSCVGIFLPAAMLPISYAIFGYPPPDLWRLPLDTHSFMGRDNYIGFFVDYLIEFPACLACYIVISLSGTIYIGIFVYVDAMVRDMKMNIMAIDDSNEPTPKRRWSIFVKEITIHHIEIIGVTESLFNVMEAIMFNMTLTCTVVIAFNLFVIESSNGVDFETYIAIMDICTIPALTFAYFYLSERFTKRLLEIDDVFYNSPWYDRLTAKQQKLLVLGVQRAQREVRLTGLGLFECSLPIFAGIIRLAGSYYLMIRSF